MVDVGGLEPGNYTVSIADANVIGNQTQSIQSPTSNNPTRRPAFGTRTLQGPADESNPNGFVPNSTGPPVEAPGAVSPPQSNLEPPSGEAPRTTLAQVTGNAASDATPPATGQIQSLTASATGQVNPTNTAPTGRSNVPDAQGGSSNENRNAAAPPMQNSVGTLTVDQSGTGRMQQVVEGVRVRNVLGQALVIYAATNSPTTLLPNLDVTVDPASPKPTPKSESSNSPNSPPASSANRAEPVVGGVIHLLSDRGGPAIGQKSN